MVKRCFVTPLSHSSFKFRTLPLFAALFLPFAYGEEDRDLLDLSLEELLSVEVVSASGVKEKLKNAAASLIVVSDKQIQQRGYSTLGEVLQDLPGFDFARSYGHDKTIAYQRGYRTNSNQRTLYMFNGVIANLLWSHEFAVNYQVPMANIKRIEVLYGPAGAIYGPNAFSGVVNIITKDASELGDGERYFDTVLESRSYDAQSLDVALGGRIGEISYSLSGKLYESEGPELSDFPTWGFLRQEYLSDETIWGPILDKQNLNRPYGQYYSPDKERSIIADFSWHNFTLGLIDWETSNGYGLKQPFDRGQMNAMWSKGTTQWFVRHKKNISHKLTVESFYKQQKDHRGGDWAEAEPDWNAGMEGYSYVSRSLWNMESEAWKFKQDWTYQANDDLKLRFGFKYENKNMTKVYDICGYWSSAFCSSSAGLELGPEGLGEGIYHSTSSEPVPDFAGPLAKMPTSNRIITSDKGLYIQGTKQVDDFVYAAAIRWDRNSEYGGFVKPRLSAIYHYNDDNTFKFIYATAYQEPAPILLYGGWNGRRANPDLRAEEITNVELIWLRKVDNWLHDVSVYHTQFDNVIKEQAENAGERKVTGLEYRGSYFYSNPISGLSDIEGYVNYTYTDVVSNIVFDHQLRSWVGSGIDACQSGDIVSSDSRCRSVEEDLGDIAPHKLNLGFNMPLMPQLSLNLRVNYVSERELYLANTLRGQGQKLDGYTVLNSSIRYQWQDLELVFKVNNLLDEEYYDPGLAAANSGDVTLDANGNLARYDNGNLVRSGGYQSSLMPQLKRNYAFLLKGRF